MRVFCPFPPHIPQKVTLSLIKAPSKIVNFVPLKLTLICIILERKREVSRGSWKSCKNFHQNNYKYIFIYIYIHTQWCECHHWIVNMKNRSGNSSWYEFLPYKPVVEFNAMLVVVIVFSSGIASLLASVLI